MQAFRSNNDHDYGIFVTIENKDFPPEESLPIPIPIPDVSISLNIIISYNGDSDITAPIKAYDARLELHHPFHSFKSNSRDIVSHMIDAMHIPFPLDRLRWKTQRFNGGTEPLESVEAMIRRLAHVADAMADYHGECGRNNKLRIVVMIEKEIAVIAHQLLDEMQQLEGEAIQLREALEAQSTESYDPVLLLSGQVVDGVRALVGRVRKVREHWETLVLHHHRVLLSADFVRILEDMQDMIFAVRSEVGRNSAAICVILNTLRANTADNDDGITEQAIRESLDQAVFVAMPATKASVEALEKFVFDGSSSDQRCCVVCLEKMLSGEQVTCLPCSHMFHARCIVQWFDSGHTCPMCRFKFPTDP